jgi:hypothetical protein
MQPAAQLPITARMCIGASEGASGSAALRRAAPPHRPLALVGLGAASHTCRTLWAIALFCILCMMLFLAIRGKRLNPIAEDLIAPCGMNCAICSRYLSHINDSKRSKCIGCRPKKDKCVYLFEKCTGINHSLTSKKVFCYKCDQYPCKQLNRMDRRYKANYLMSTKDNLDYIKNFGIGSFVKEQYRKYRCSRCGGVISIHNRKCFQCDTITKLVEIHDKEYA